MNFQTLKAALISSTILKSPNPDLTFILQTDASNLGVAVVLSQRDSFGNDYLIAYFSKKLLDQERKYAIVDRADAAGRAGRASALPLFALIVLVFRHE